MTKEEILQKTDIEIENICAIVKDLDESEQSLLKLFYECRDAQASRNIYKKVLNFNYTRRIYMEAVAKLQIAKKQVVDLMEQGDMK